MRRIHRKAYREIKYNVIFFVLLTLFTVFSIIDLESEQKPTLKSLQNINDELIGDKSNQLRRPASSSVLSNNDQNNVVAPLFINKEFFCKRAENRAQVNKVFKNLVMVNFNLCLDEKLIDSITFKNISNRFGAQIFKIEGNNFKTDYIQLNSGVNRLKIEVILKDGQKLQESLEILSGS
ncbi:MAG: hypothetical protein AABY53_07940 [Bdellovibrionota bacterium]